MSSNFTFFTIASNKENNEPPKKGKSRPNIPSLQFGLQRLAYAGAYTAIDPRSQFNVVRQEQKDFDQIQFERAQFQLNPVGERNTPELELWRGSAAATKKLVSQFTKYSVSFHQTELPGKNLDLFI